MKHLNIVKIGGNIIDHQADLNAFMDRFSSMKGKKILVHGGGRSASTLSQKLGIEIKMNAGRRITDEATIEIVSMVYAGINKKMVAGLQARHCNAVGLCGADMNIIPAEKRKHPSIDYGYVGDVKKGSVNIPQLHYLLENDITPVFCALTHDGNGSLLNTNADTIAAVLAMALAPYNTTTLTYCFEKKGVLSDLSDDNSIMDSLDYHDYQHLKGREVIHQGMIPKLDNAFEALRNGVHQVFIKHARHLLDSMGTRLSYERPS